MLGNRRMNDDLTTFTQRLYGEKYTADVPGGRLALRSQPPLNDESQGPGAALLAALHAHRVFHAEAAKLPSLVAIVLRPGALLAASSVEQQTGAEAAVVATLVHTLQDHAEWGASGEGEKLMVITPRRLQRAAVRAALGPRGASVTVDTTERVQGREADAVVVCMGLLDGDRIAATADFVFSHPRINVAVTRARKLCVLVITDAVLCALSDRGGRGAATSAVLGAVVGVEARQAALMHLRAFVASAVRVEVDV
jgi:hypothetical protein